jgi:hypothetical protein
MERLARAADALRRGDPLAVLKVTDARDDGLALAMRAVALAQIDERRSARAHLVRAERAFTAEGSALSALRARLAEAEVAVWDHDLSHARTRLLSSAQELRERGDHPNAAWALIVAARAAWLQGDAAGAGMLLVRCREETRTRALPPHVAAVLAMTEAEHAARELRADDAHARAEDALRHARRAGHPALVAEAERFAEALRAPVAKGRDGELLVLDDVAKILRAPRGLVIDACRARVVAADFTVDLARRPVLFELLAAVARAAPEAVSARDLAREVFGAHAPNASHDARLRVELGRLRKALGPFFSRAAKIVQERRAVRLVSSRPLIVLSPIVSRREARLRAALGDGRAWPVKALCDALGQSPRTVQRLLGELREQGVVSALGAGRARSYALEGRVPRIASWMLLPDLALEG